MQRYFSDFYVHNIYVRLFILNLNYIFPQSDFITLGGICSSTFTSCLRLWLPHRQTGNRSHAAWPRADPWSQDEATGQGSEVDRQRARKWDGGLFLPVLFLWLFHCFLIGPPMLPGVWPCPRAWRGRIRTHCWLPSTTTAGSFVWPSVRRGSLGTGDEGKGGREVRKWVCGPSRGSSRGRTMCCAQAFTKSCRYVC